ncbi:MAG: STY0301 family protein [Candidatus Korobacteraceae bacterium]
MLSIEHSLAWAFLWLSLALVDSSAALAQQKQLPAPVVCPTSITVDETAGPVSGWTVVPAKGQNRFERISVYNVGADKQEFDLAPDHQKQNGTRVTQTWDLKGYRTLSLFMRCRYQETSVVLLRELKPDVDTCTLRFTIDAKGNITGESNMECR